MARVWFKLARQFFNTPIYGDIIQNHLKDWKYVALNISSHVLKFQQDVLVGMGTCEELINNHKKEIKELTDLKI